MYTRAQERRALDQLEQQRQKEKEQAERQRLEYQIQQNEIIRQDAQRYQLEAQRHQQQIQRQQLDNQKREFEKFYPNVNYPQISPLFSQQQQISQQQQQQQQQQQTSSQQYGANQSTSSTYKNNVNTPVTTIIKPTRASANSNTELDIKFSKQEAIRQQEPQRYQQESQRYQQEPQRYQQDTPKQYQTGQSDIDVSDTKSNKSENERLQAEKATLNKLNEQLREEVGTFDKLQREKDGKIEKLQQDVANLTINLASANKSAIEWENSTSRLRQQLGGTENDNTKLRDESRSQNDKLAKFLTQIADLQKERNSLESDNSFNKREVNDLAKKNAEKEANIERLRKDIDELKDKSDRLRDDNCNLSTVKKNQADEIRRLKEENSASQTKVASLQESLNASRSQVTELREETRTLSSKHEKAQKEATEYRSKSSRLEQEVTDLEGKCAVLQGNVEVAIKYLNSTLKIKSSFTDTLLDILSSTSDGAAQQVAAKSPSRESTQTRDTSLVRENSDLRVAKPAPVIYATSIQPTRFTVKVPVCCAKNASDIPDVLDVFNEIGSTVTPSVSFHLQPYDTLHDGGPEMLAVVLALCGTDRVDIVDKDLLSDLRETKGCAEVLMVILRRGNDPSKFKPNHDASIHSGVKTERALFQLIHFKGKILMDSDMNKNAVSKFFDFVKMAFPR
jgi:chromosome segregation ATPase